MAEPTRTRSVTATRTLGALALLVIGGVHYQQYHYAFYSSIPTIGPLFLLNFIAGTALGLFLIVPVRPRLGRLGTLLDQLAALAGLGVAAGALVALLISEHTPLFGFMEHGYRFVIVLTHRSRCRCDRDAHAVPSVRAHRPRDQGAAPRQSDPTCRRRASPSTNDLPFRQPRRGGLSDAEAMRDHDSGPLDEGRLSRRPSPPAR